MKLLDTKGLFLGALGTLGPHPTCAPTSGMEARQLRGAKASELLPGRVLPAPPSTVPHGGDFLSGGSFLQGMLAQLCAQVSVLGGPLFLLTWPALMYCQPGFPGRESVWVRGEGYGPLIRRLGNAGMLTGGFLR